MDNPRANAMCQSTAEELLIMAIFGDRQQRLYVRRELDRRATMGSERRSQDRKESSATAA